MSTETFDRILWVVLDGFGHEHARRLLRMGAGAGRRIAICLRPGTGSVVS